MSGKDQDIRRSSLIMDGVNLPLGAEDVVVEITPDAKATMKDGNESTIFEHKPVSTAVMVVSAYAQDTLFKVLVPIHAAEDLAASQGLKRVPKPGMHRNGAAGYIDTWEDAVLMQGFASGSGRTAAIRTCTYNLVGHRRVLA